MPHGSMGGANVVYGEALEFGECSLHGLAIFADDIGVVAIHLVEEVVEG